MKKTKIMLVLVLTLVFSLALFGCDNAADNGTNNAADENNNSAAPAPNEDDAAGFEEFDIGEAIDFEPYIHVAGVYFQPVILYPEGLGLSQDKANMHIEADISALEGNGFGFGAGDWVPFLTVDYEIINKDTGETTLDGTFMPMSASDGPHYGANLLLEEAGTYTVRFIIKDPSEAGYVLHVDEATGVERHEWWPEPLVAEWEFNYVPNEDW